MKPEILQKFPLFLETIGADEEPMGIFYTDQQPDKGFSPEPPDLPTREKEARNEINWGAIFGGFSCVMGHIWRARRKKLRHILMHSESDKALRFAGTLLLVPMDQV